MKQQDIKVDKLRYDPFDPDLIQKLENDYGKIDLGIDKKLAAKYLVLFYDINTPFRERYPDVIERRKRCAEMAGFPLDDNKHYPQRYEDLMIGENENFNTITYQFLKSFGSPDYIALQILWKIYGNEFINAAKNVDSKTYKDTINNTLSILKHINDLTKTLFSGEESQNMRMALYKGMEKELRMPTPENIANAEDIDELLHNPYGDYKPEELHYKGAK